MTLSMLVSPAKRRLLADAPMREETFRVVGILAAITIPAYQDYTLRAQVSEGLNLARPLREAIADQYQNTGQIPDSRTDIGMSFEPADSSGSYVAGIDVSGGRIEITYGNRANAQLEGAVVALTPYETADGQVVWRCAAGPEPAGTIGPLGASGNGLEAVYWAGSLAEQSPQYLPSACRP